MKKKKQATTPFQEIEDRVERQIRNIYEVDPTEAYAIAMAHFRMFNRMTAWACDGDEEYVDKLDTMHKLLRKEGLALRHQHGKK